MPLQVLRLRRRVALTESPRDYPDADLVAEVRALGWVDALGGYTVETRPQNGAKASVALPPNVVRVDGSTMENGLLRVVVAPDGAVSVEDLASGRVVADTFRLEDADEPVPALLEVGADEPADRAPQADRDRLRGPSGRRRGTSRARWQAAPVV